MGFPYFYILLSYPNTTLVVTAIFAYLYAILPLRKRFIVKISKYEYNYEYFCKCKSNFL